MNKLKKRKKDQRICDALLGTLLGELRDRSPKKSGIDLFIIGNIDEEMKIGK